MNFEADRKYRRWTPTAIMCYERGCVCIGCPIDSILETQCLMKQSVLILVRQLGKPPKLPQEEENQ